MLVLHVDNTWEPHDFVQVLTCVESMYYKLHGRGYRSYRRYPFYLDAPFLVDRDFSPDRSYVDELDRINWMLAERARYDASPSDKMVVSRIQYASPGSIDLLGIGKACESISNAISRMVSYYDERHIRRERDAQASLETERKGIEIERDRETLRSLKIQNAKEMLELERDLLLPLLVRDQDGLAERIADGRLIGAETKKG